MSDVKLTAPEPECMLDSVTTPSETPREEYDRVMAQLKCKIKAYNTVLVAELDSDGRLSAKGRIYLTDADNASINPGDEVSILIIRFYAVKNEDSVTIDDRFYLSYIHKGRTTVEYNSGAKKECLAMALERLFRMRDIALEDI